MGIDPLGIEVLAIEPPGICAFGTGLGVFRVAGLIGPEPLEEPPDDELLANIAGVVLTPDPLGVDEAVVEEGSA